MAVIDQPKTTYSDTTPHVRVISDVVKIIDPRETPLIAALGGLDSARSKFKVKQNGYKVELLEDELAPLSGTCAHTTTIATDATNWPVSDASVFQDGHVILIDNEYMVVKAADTSGNTVTVYSRSYGGTNATHASTSAIEIVGMARLEGDATDYGPLNDITAPYNYTSIFQKGIKVSETQLAITQYGITDEMDYQAAKAVPELLRLVEKAIFHGVRSAGAAGSPRSMGGLNTFITNNSVDAGGAIAKSDIDNAMEYAYNDGGYPDLLVMNPGPARDLKDLIDTSNYVHLSYENDQVGMQPIKRVVTQYGELQLIMSRFCPVSKAFLLQSDRVGLYTLRPFGWKPLGAAGDSEEMEVKGEFSLLVANDKAHAWVYGITS